MGKDSLQILRCHCKCHSNRICFEPFKSIIDSGMNDIVVEANNVIDFCVNWNLEVFSFSIPSSSSLILQESPALKIVPYLLDCYSSDSDFFLSTYRKMNHL